VYILLPRHLHPWEGSPSTFHVKFLKFTAVIPSEQYPFQSSLVLRAINVSFRWQQEQYAHPVTG
jgi:hypothetical protein